MTRKSWGEVQIPKRVAERAATRFTVFGACHISTYSISPQGYAQVGWKEPEDERSTMTLAHRAAWVHYTGEQIPPEMTIDHSSAAGCTSRRCIRREHLRVLPNLENARRTSGRDWPLGTCLHGHGVEHWKPKAPKRKKGYCAECRRLRRLENIG